MSKRKIPSASPRWRKPSMTALEICSYDVRDIDDTAYPELVCMRRNREAGYRALGYRRQRDLELF